MSLMSNTYAHYAYVSGEFCQKLIGPGIRGPHSHSKINSVFVRFHEFTKVY